MPTETRQQVVFIFPNLYFPFPVSNPDSSAFFSQWRATLYLFGPYNMLGIVREIEGDKEAHHPYFHSAYRNTNDTYYKHSLESDTSIYLTSFYDSTPLYSSPMNSFMPLHLPKVSPHFLKATQNGKSSIKFSMNPGAFNNLLLPWISIAN